jgi:hypothetical protein
MVSLIYQFDQRIIKRRDHARDEGIGISEIDKNFLAMNRRRDGPVKVFVAEARQLPPYPHSVPPPLQPAQPYEKVIDEGC